jgi:hypothetical protein
VTGAAACSSSSVSLDDGKPALHGIKKEKNMSKKSWKKFAGQENMLFRTVLFYIRRVEGRTTCEAAHKRER